MIVHENEWYWFAGLYEGEGSVSKPPASEPRRFRVNIEMRDTDVLLRAGKMVGVGYLQRRKADQAHHSDLFKLIIRGKNAIRTMMTIFPIMGERRQQQIQKMLDLSDWEVQAFLKLSIPERNSNAELYWLAGLLEAEGTFLTGIPTRPNKIAIRLWMTDRDIVARVGEIWDSNVGSFQRNEDVKTAYFVDLSGKTALAWMQRLYPLMGLRRQAQIDRSIAGYDPDYERKGRIKGNITKAKLNPDQVREVRRRLKNREDYLTISKDFGVPWHIIMEIARLKTWAWLDAEEKN